MTRFLYDGSDMIAEYNSSNALLRRYVFGPGVDEPLVWYEGSGTTDRRYLVADERGSIVAVTNSAGAASGSGFGINSYDEYGTPGPSNLGRFQYTGQAWLPEAGLYNYKARAYAPALGRFLQTDPIGFGGGMNLYAYVGNDPVNGRDPSGLQEEDEPIIVRACRNGESLANHCQPLPPAWARVVSVNNFLENWLSQNDGGRQLEALMAAMAARIAAMETRTVRRRAEAALRAVAQAAACAALDAGSSLATSPEGFVSFGDSTYTSASAIAFVPGIQMGGGGSVTRFTERSTGTRTYTANGQVNFGVADRGPRRPPTGGNDVNRRFFRGGASASITWGGSRGPGGVQLETVVVGPVSGQFAVGREGLDAAGIGLGVGDSYSLSGQLPGGFTYVCH